MSTAAKRRKYDIYDVIIVIVTAIIGLLTVYPMYYVCIMSVSDPQMIAAGRVFFWVEGVQLKSYATVVQNPDIWRAYFNTIIYAGGTTALMLLTSVMGAYPLTVGKLIGRKVYVFFLLVPMYVSGGLIPTYLLMTKIGLYNNIWAIIIPSGYGIGNLILTNTYFRSSIGEEIRESAKIDGANHLTILFRIYMPLAVPLLAVIAIYTIVGVWNSWFNSALYLTNKNLHPLQMFMRSVLIEKTIDFTVMTKEEITNALLQNQQKLQFRYAAIVASTLPVLLTYPFLQKYFIKGIMIGSLKG